MVDTTDKRTHQDFEDQQNEIAGRDTGRMARFGVGTSRAQDIKEKERSERAFRDALDRLLADPEYRALYLELGDKLGAAETEADTAIAMIQEQLRLAEQTIDSMQADAARDPDGKPVFQYADGRVVYADGSEVPPEIAEGIIWPEDAPSAEDYFAAKDRRDTLQTQLDDWLIYRNDVLGGIRDRYDDPKNPFPDKDGLNDALDRIEKLAPDANQLHVSQNTNAVPTPSPVSRSMLPTELNT